MKKAFRILDSLLEKIVLLLGVPAFIFFAYYEREKTILFLLSLSVPVAIAIVLWVRKSWRNKIVLTTFIYFASLTLLIIGAALSDNLHNYFDIFTNEDAVKNLSGSFKVAAVVSVWVITRAFDKFADFMEDLLNGESKEDPLKTKCTCNCACTTTET